MFGVDDDRLIEGLEALRRRACCYMTPNPDDRCDCKFGATGQGEQTGCPEIRQAIKFIQGQRDQVLLTRDLFEQNARNTLAEVVRVIERWQSVG